MLCLVIRCHRSHLIYICRWGYVFTPFFFWVTEADNNVKKSSVCINSALKCLERINLHYTVCCCCCFKLCTVTNVCNKFTQADGIFLGEGNQRTRLKLSRCTTMPDRFSSASNRQINLLCTSRKLTLANNGTHSSCVCLCVLSLICIRTKAVYF